MSNIIQFVPGQSRQAPRGGAPEMSATLLFFTGVRYERRPDSETIEPRARTMRSTSRGAAAKSAEKRAPDYHDDTTPMGHGRRG